MLRKRLVVMWKPKNRKRTSVRGRGGGRASGLLLLSGDLELFLVFYCKGLIHFVCSLCGDGRVAGGVMAGACRTK